MLAKSKIISIILIIIFCVSAVTCGIVFGVSKSQPQSTATTESATLTTNLFNTNGTINSTAAYALLDAVGYYDHYASTTGYTAHNIAGRTSNNSGNSIIFKMGYANSTSGTDLVWQATYLYNNYLTIWLDKNYNMSYWNLSNVSVSYTSYASSTIQAYLDDTLYGTITQSSSTLKSIFATPREAGYQTIKSGTTNDTSYYYSSSYTSKFDNMSSGVADSYLWLPSFGEVFNNTTSSYSNSTTAYTGQWGLNSTDRAFDSSTSYSGSSTSAYCRLRSGYSYGNRYAVVVTDSGSSSYDIVDRAYGVRPAAHLSLSSIASLAKWQVSFNPNGGSNCASINVINNMSYGSLPTPTKTGYSFAGWYKNSDFSGSPVTSSDIVTADHTLYAKWMFAEVSGSSTTLSSYEIVSETGTKIYYLIPQTGHYVSEFSFDNSTFYAVECYSGQVVDFDFAPVVTYMAGTKSNQFTLKIEGMYLNYTGAINIYLKTTATPYANLKSSGGTSVSGVAVSATKGGSVTLIGDEYENLADSDTITCVAKVCVPGYKFDGWYSAEDMETCLSIAESKRFSKTEIYEKQIIAVFSPIDNTSVNDSLTN